MGGRRALDEGVGRIEAIASNTRCSGGERYKEINKPGGVREGEGEGGTHSQKDNKRVKKDKEKEPLWVFSFLDRGKRTSF